MESTHPREGTETSAAVASSSNFRIESTHPREGTETGRETTHYKSEQNQLTPARGRKHKRVNIHVQSPLNQLTPARGRKLRLPRKRISCGNQLTPARGRKRIVKFVIYRHFCESTHPREGTETHSPSLQSIACPESTHPREGTETFLLLSWLGHVGNQLTPARGRKQGRRGHALQGAWNQLTPARGRKPHHRRYCSFFFENQLTPRKGTNSI